MSVSQAGGTPAPNAAAVRPNLALALIGLVMFWPIGIAAVVSTLIARRLLRSGDPHGASGAARLARRLSFLAIVVGVLLVAAASTAFISVLAIGR